MGKSLLLISNRPEDQAFAGEVAVMAKLSLVTVKDPRSCAEGIARQEYAVILADVSTERQYQELESMIQETVGLFSDKINANAIHFLTDGELEGSQYLVQSPIFGHFVRRNYGNAADAGKHYGRIVAATLSDRAFGQKQLLEPTAKVQVVKLHKTTQKQDAVEAIRNYLLAAKFQSRMASLIANAVDELLMNAMFDAPVDEIGRQTFAQTPRQTALPLDGQHAVEMHVGYDGNYVAVTAVDLYGSLDKARLLSVISKIYTDQAYKVKTSVAGAGIGLATVFHSGGSFFFVSESRVRTEVTVFFKRMDNFREFKDQFRFISTQFYF